MKAEKVKVIFNIIVVLVFFIGCGENGYEEAKVEYSTKCDYLIDKGYFQICYDYDLKGAKYVSYYITGFSVNENNIAERPEFYVEPLLPTQYISEPSDYDDSGYDKGHLASDASFDYDNTPLYRTYSMANIVPQVPQFNKSGWLEIENLEREMAIKYGGVDVFIGVNYLDKPLRIGKNQIAVPQSFYKILSHEAFKYKACYLYENTEIINTEADTIEDHEVNCSLLVSRYQAIRSNVFGFNTNFLYPINNTTNTTNIPSIGGYGTSPNSSHVVCGKGCCSSHDGCSSSCSSNGNIICNDGTVSASCKCL